MSVRAGVRRMIPLAWRQALAHARRAHADRPQRTRLATHRAPPVGMHVVAELRQPIMPSALFDNKLANLTAGAARVSGSCLAPGLGPSSLWSFWAYVGEPTARNGFVVGRNLVDGQLQRQLGGGLCQLSSLLYHLGLMAGLTATERHPHSLDIYQEADRFTPLGADATVVWGYKDLRFVQPRGQTVQFVVRVEGHHLIGQVCCATALAARPVSFIRAAKGQHQAHVATWVDGQLIAETDYRCQPGLALVSKTSESN